MRLLTLHKISVIVALENAGGGGSNAAPISRSVMDYWLGEKYARQ